MKRLSKRVESLESVIFGRSAEDVSSVEIGILRERLNRVELLWKMLPGKKGYIKRDGDIDKIRYFELAEEHIQWTYPWATSYEVGDIVIIDGQGEDCLYKKEEFEKIFIDEKDVSKILPKSSGKSVIDK